MSVLRRLLSRTPPATLYHYTSQLGLLGIVRDEELWATKITFLNDSAELTLALSLARQAVLDADIERKLEQELLRSLGLMSDSSINICLCSFTENGDQLSQWRGYTRPGDGYSIGFDAQRLKVAGVHAGFTLGPCTYKETQQAAIVNSLVQRAVHRSRATKTRPSPPSLRTIATEFHNALYFAAPFIKHAAFQEEREWRLVSAPVGFGLLSHRQGPSHLVPYIRLPLRVGSAELPIAEVLVGPTPQPVLALDSLESLLLSRGVTPCSFGNSSIPFRHW